MSAAVLGIALSLAGYYWDGWAAMPVAVRSVTGLIAFGLSPGLLIAGPLVAGRSRAIEEFTVDIVVVDPAESDSVRQSIESDGDLRRMLKPVFEAKGFLVYQVAGPRLTAERSLGRGCCGG